MYIMESKVLYGVSKKLRNDFRNGKVTEEFLRAEYNKNKEAADTFFVDGLAYWELCCLLEQQRLNPLIAEKIEAGIQYYKTQKSKKQIKKQNAESLKKLAHFKEDAWGMGGLRNVLSQLKKLYRKSGDLEVKAILLLLETEFANLTAKIGHYSSRSKKIYERKSMLLMHLADVLEKVGWKHGVNCETGKRANYLVFAYLPNGVQLTWHANEYEIYTRFPRIDSHWDGQVCSTMQKILVYIAEKYNFKR